MYIGENPCFLKKSQILGEKTHVGRFFLCENLIRKYKLGETRLVDWWFDVTDKNKILNKYSFIFNFRLTLGDVGSFKYRLRSTPWVNLNLPYSITTKNIEIRVIGVENILFGGFKEIKLFGCGPTLDDWNSVVTGRPYQNPGGGGLNRQPSEPIVSENHW